MGQLRDLTAAECARLLTQQEVDALPDGTRVFVKWSGGNGPHLYETVRLRGQMCVQNLYRDPLRFVGKEPFHTRVFLADGDDANTQE
jgi:hypothetical protein